MNIRLSKFIDAEDISQSQFAAAVGVGAANISHIISGRNRPGYDFIVALMKAYPRLNIEWLLTGEGRMYKEEGKPSQNSKSDVSLYASDELFDSQSFEDSPLPEENPVSEPLGATFEPQIQPEKPVFSNSRKVVKAIVFYSDGTYQELR